MPLENEMRTPAAYVGKTGVLSRAFAIIVILYIAMGLFGLLILQQENAYSYEESIESHTRIVNF